MMLAGYACVHQGYKRHSPPNYLFLKRCCVGMILAGDACVHQDAMKDTAHLTYSLLKDAG